MPTFEWDRAAGGDAALVEGTVTFLGQCPVIVDQVARVYDRPFG